MEGQFKWFSNPRENANSGKTLNVELSKQCFPRVPLPVGVEVCVARGKAASFKWLNRLKGLGSGEAFFGTIPHFIKRIPLAFSRTSWSQRSRITTEICFAAIRHITWISRHLFLHSTLFHLKDGIVTHHWLVLVHRERYSTFDGSQETHSHGVSRTFFATKSVRADGMSLRTDSGAG